MKRRLLFCSVFVLIALLPANVAKAQFVSRHMSDPVMPAGSATVMEECGGKMVWFCKRFRTPPQLTNYFENVIYEPVISINSMAQVDCENQ